MESVRDGDVPDVRLLQKYHCAISEKLLQNTRGVEHYRLSYIGTEKTKLVIKLFKKHDSQIKYIKRKDRIYDKSSI